MTALTRGITTGTLLQQCPRSVQLDFHALAAKRLTEVFKAAEEVPFDDTSRFVFFSDCHRGDNSRADAFAINENLFLRALGYYHRHGFTYIEVGDGDELWKNRRFCDVREAHGRAFDLFQVLCHRLWC